MTRQPLSQIQRLLLLASISAGLFLMHGVQATPSPVQAAGAMVGMVHHDSAAMAAASGPATAERAASTSHSCASGHCGDAHPGGAICFALLALAGLVLLLTAVRTVPRPLTLTGRHVLFVRRGPPRARPPSVYQLSVLRL
jgi:hypothetical protein